MIRRMSPYELRIRRRQILRELIENCRSGEEQEIRAEFNKKRGSSRVGSTGPKFESQRRENHSPEEL